MAIFYIWFSFVTSFRILWTLHRHMGLKSVFANNEMWWANNVISHLRQSGDWMRHFPGFPFNVATLFFVLYICIMIDLNRSRHFHFCPTVHRRKEKRIKVFNSSLTDTSYEVIYINFIWLAAINRSYKKGKNQRVSLKDFQYAQGSPWLEACLDRHLYT